MAEEVTVNLRVKQSGVQEAGKSFEEIKKKLKEVEQSAKKGLTDDGFKKIQNGAKKTEQAAKSVKIRLRELEDEMANIGDVGSPEFQKLAKEAGVLRDKMNNARAAINSMSSDFPKLQVGMQAFQAVGGGVQAATGSMAAFGMESAAVQESMQKMIAIQSILNGVQTVSKTLSDETALGLKIRTALTNAQVAAEKRAKASTIGMTIVQKALNIVLSMNPIGLIIAAVVALGAAIYALWGPIKQLLQFFGIMEDDAIDVAAAHKKITAEYEAQMKAMKKLREQQERDHKHEMSLLDIRHKRIIEDMEEQGASAEQLTEEMRISLWLFLSLHFCRSG